RALLIESILQPSRQIVEGYRTVTIVVDDGRVLQGLVSVETPTELALVDAQGNATTLRTASIEVREYSDASLMPDGLTSGLTPQAVADLVAYLETLRSAG